MPQIGWFELLLIVLIAILVIGPKDFPVVLKKIGNWIGSTKRYFSEIQEKVNQTIDQENIQNDNNSTDKTKNKKKDE